MARKAILETGYTFTPSTNTIVIPRAIPRERLILITNVTTNTVIYNFSDSNLKANTYTVSTTGGTNTTTLVLNYNTSGMTSTDKLQITVDEYDERFTPSEAYQVVPILLKEEFIPASKSRTIPVLTISLKSVISSISL